MRPSPNPGRMAWMLTLTCALAAPHSAPAGQWPDGPRCVDTPPPLGALEEVDVAWAAEMPLGGGYGGDVTGDPLDPGETQATLGTNKVESPELKPKLIVVKQSTSFSFTTTSGPVTGVFEERVDSGKDCNCKSHVRIRVTAGCVGKVVIRRYVHPIHKPIVADWRDDQGKSFYIPSDKASRSTVAVDQASTFTFSFLPPFVCAGQTSRWLLLNTSIDHVSEVPDGIFFVAPNGQGSNTYRFHVPLTAQ